MKIMVFDGFRDFFRMFPDFRRTFIKKIENFYRINIFKKCNAVSYRSENVVSAIFVSRATIRVL